MNDQLTVAEIVQTPRLAYASEIRSFGPSICFVLSMDGVVQLSAIRTSVAEDGALAAWLSGDPLAQKFMRLYEEAATLGRGDEDDSYWQSLQDAVPVDASDGAVARNEIAARAD